MRQGPRHPVHSLTVVPYEVSPGGRPGRQQGREHRRLRSSASNKSVVRPSYRVNLISDLETNHENRRETDCLGVLLVWTEMSHVLVDVSRHKARVYVVDSDVFSLVRLHLPALYPGEGAQTDLGHDV